MSEQPITDPQAAYGWQHVAEEYATWHPNLHPHVERHLAANGIAAAASNRHLEAVPPPAGSPAGQQEQAVSPPTAEKRGPKPEEITNALESADRTVKKISTDVQFHAFCMDQDRRVDPFDDMDKPAYWSALTDFTHQRTAVLRRKHGDSLQLQALELVAATPDFVSRQARLNASDGRRTKDYDTDREAASRYGDKLSDFVAANPQARVEDVAMTLLNTCNKSLEEARARMAADDTVYSAIRGVQGENAYGQILAHTGRKFRRGTSAEDLGGSDYIIGEGSGELHVDVKSSLHNLVKAGAEGAVSRRSDGRITMFSLATPKEFGGTFFISDEAARLKAPYLNQLLDQAAQRNAAYSAGA